MDFHKFKNNPDEYIGEDKVVIYKIKFIDSFRFMAASLSKLTDNLSNRIIENGKCKNCKSYLEFIKIRDSNRLIFECFDCKRRYNKNISDDELKSLKRKFKNTYNFCNKDINKIMLLLRKGVYPYEYIDDFDRFNEEKLPDKSAFYSSFNMEDISDIDYRHTERVFNKFNIKNLGEYHDIHVKSDTILLADIFTNFRKLCLDTYKLDPVYFLSLTGFALEACLKYTQVKLELLSDIDMLLFIEKGIRGGICHSICRNAKANNKYMKHYDENKESSFLIYTNYNNLCGKAMCEKLHVKDFKWVEDISEIDENFIKNYDEEGNIGYTIEANIEYPKEIYD